MGLTKEWVLTCDKCCEFIVHDNMVFKDDVKLIEKMAETYGWKLDKFGAKCPKCNVGKNK